MLLMMFLPAPIPHTRTLYADDDARYQWLLRHPTEGLDMEPEEYQRQIVALTVERMTLEGALVVYGRRFRSAREVRTV